MCRGQASGGTGGERSIASGCHRPKCSRMHRTTCGASINAMTRIGPLHFGHSSGSVCQACRIRSRHFRAGSLATGGGLDLGQGAASVPPPVEPGYFTLFLLRLAASPSGGDGLAFRAKQYELSTARLGIASAALPDGLSRRLARKGYEIPGYV